MSSLLLSLASGGIFGASLMASGVYSPSVIISQLWLDNFHMIKSFITASAASAVIIAAANRAKYANLSHRPDSSYGWFIRHDANIVGGLLQGIGMALTGACPGTVLVQMAVGVESAWNVAAGCVLGAIIFVKIGQRLRRIAEPKSLSHPNKYTVQDSLGLSTTSTVLLYEILCLIMILAATYLAPSRDHWLNPVAGGLLIGLAQATSVLFTKRTLSISSAWEDVGKHIWSTIDGIPRPAPTNIVFATGVALGAKIISQYIPAISEVGTSITPLAAVTGGALLIFGGRLAGGCPSGHGISGMATMSISSFITVGTMFAGGIATALLLR